MPQRHQMRLETLTLEEAYEIGRGLAEMFRNDLVSLVWAAANLNLDQQRFRWRVIPDIPPRVDVESLAAVA